MRGIVKSKDVIFMKKHIIKGRTAALGAAAMLAVSAVAPGCALGKEITVVLNGDELSFDANPKLVDGTTLVPMRKIFEELGAEVSWNSGNNTVTAVKNGKSVVAKIGSKTVTVNGEVIEAAAASELSDGNTLVPLRIISEAFGADVEWDGDSETVTITKEKKSSDESWKDNLGEVNLSEMTVSGEGNRVDGKVITITEAGDYSVSGTAEDAMIVVKSEGRVKLRLDGVNLTNTTGPAIFFDNCDKGYITVSKNTENFVADGAEYDVDAKAAIFSNDDLEIKGSGSLTVTANYKHGIASDDELKIEEGTININSVGDGLHANDGITVSGGDITIKASGDGIQSEDFVEITAGKLSDVTDGVDAADNAFGWAYGGG